MRFNASEIHVVTFAWAKTDNINEAGCLQRIFEGFLIIDKPMQIVVEGVINSKTSAIHIEAIKLTIEQAFGRPFDVFPFDVANVWFIKTEYLLKIWSGYAYASTRLENPVALSEHENTFEITDVLNLMLGKDVVEAAVLERKPLGSIEKDNLRRVCREIGIQPAR